MQVNYIIKRSKRKTISIVVKDNTVFVLAPLFASENQIQSIVDEHSGWIEKKLRNPKININYDLENDNKLYILGREYPFIIKTGLKNNIYILEGILYLEGKSLNSIDKSLKQYLIEILNVYVVNIKDELCIEFEVEYKKFRSKWGCCYKSQRLIVVNYLCACLPVDTLKQVIYHEITHLKVANHQKEFYQNLEKLCPDYKKQVKILKQFTIA